MADRVSLDTTPSGLLREHLIRTRDMPIYPQYTWLSKDQLEILIAALAMPSPPAPQEPADAQLDKGWLKRQMAQAAEDIKELPAWLRTPVTPAVPDHAGLVKERELLLKAVNDEKLSDGTVRCIVRDVLSPEPVTADDIEWAKAALRPTGGDPQ